MPGRNGKQLSGLPRGLYQQVPEAAYASAFPPQRDCDEQLGPIVRAMACAIREARPLITLPPHVSPPWRAEPLLREVRSIVVRSTDAAVNAGAANAAQASGLDLLSMDASAAGFEAIDSYVVPTQQIAVVRKLFFDVDELGYFVPSPGDDPVVTFRVMLGGDRLSLLAPKRVGVRATPERPLDVFWVVPQLKTIEIQVRSTDANAWHVVEAGWEGYLVPTAEITDQISSLTPEAFCP